MGATASEMATDVAKSVFSKKTLVLGASTALVGSVGMEMKNRFIAAEPNEWLLLIKDGELVKKGVGITVFRGIGETVVRFPSLLNKVFFSAQQVSKEMSGVELSGFVIWVINREGINPLKAYKHIKDLANLEKDSEVNQHIKSMAESIVRHEIANLSINEVISERKKVRDGITQAMQEILSGWGIWLETVEITDVKILSGTLFNNLQQPFRSATRQTAEKIRIDTENDLQEKRVMTQFKLNKIRNEKDTEIAIERSRQKLKQEEAEQKILDQREEIKRRNIEMKKKTAILQSQMDQEIAAKKQEAEEQRILHNLKLRQLQLDYELKKTEDQYAVDSKMGDVNMKKQILESFENMYKNMNVREMKIVNFGRDSGLEQGIGKFAMALNQVQKQLGDEDE